MAPSGRKRAGKTIQAVETALEVLDELRRRESATLAELDAALPHSKSTLHHHLATLEQAGFVASEDATYRLGLGLLTYGGQARAATEPFDVAREAVDRLAAETGEVARLVAEWDHDLESVAAVDPAAEPAASPPAGITLYQSTGEHADRPWSAVGEVQPLHCTAAGKALLATLPSARGEDPLADATLPACTDATVTDADELREELAAIRSNGVAFDDEERREGVRGVAAPVTDRGGDPLCAIEVAGATDRVSDERFRAELPDAVQNVVGVVEVESTYADWADGS